MLTGHKGAVLDLEWSRDSRVVYSASADMHLASWDLETGKRIRKHPGHEEVINCIDVSKRGEEFLISGSDDGYIGVSEQLTLLLGVWTDGVFVVVGSSAESSCRLYRDALSCDGDRNIRSWKRAVFWRH